MHKAQVDELTEKSGIVTNGQEAFVYFANDVVVLLNVFKSVRRFTMRSWTVLMKSDDIVSY